MIPSVLARQVRHGIEDFLVSTFPVNTPFFKGVFERFLDRKADQVFKGPYISVKLPFRPGLKGKDFFPEIPMKYPAFLHQEQSFERLSAHPPKSTIVATGTGSGKTDCFIYPMLDHCLGKRGESGIKAIVIYPMNALVNDQGRRFAQIVHGTPSLKGKVRIGLYIGERGQETSAMMTADSVITDRDAMRAAPPDILLTNYKMLDYLLIRPEDKRLWEGNGPETLQYIVVDELHSFDGAQGTDLACLLRRLKSRLLVPKGHLCCIGTSATLGNTKNPGELIDYAGTIFGELFTADSIIGEKTLDSDEFFAGTAAELAEIPPPDNSAQMDPYSYASMESYAGMLAELWFGIRGGQLKDAVWRLELGEKLKRHIFFRNMVAVISRRMPSESELVQEMEKLDAVFARGDYEYKERLLTGIFALVSISLRKTDDGAIMPFLNLRFQTWLREMRRIVCETGREPSLKFANDLNSDELGKHLPLVHCRECGSMGWLTSKKSNESSISQDLNKIYEAFFHHSPTVNFIFPDSFPAGAGQYDNLFRQFICSRCMKIITFGAKSEISCPACKKGDSLIPVHVSNEIRENSSGHRYISPNCPYCSAFEGLTIVGSRAPSMISVAVSQIFASVFNDDKKVLAFSDSVQDAAHRAGFFGARTFRFGLRAAVQQFLSAEKECFSLSELSGRFNSHYLSLFGEEKFISTFIASDMKWLDDYEHLEKTGKIPSGSKLSELCRKRVDWEIFSEFGFRCRIGRTLEKSGLSVAVFDDARLNSSVNSALEALRNEFGGLRTLSERTLKSLMLGFLLLQKSKGGIFHGALEKYIEDFGNYYPLSNLGLNKLFMPKFAEGARTPAFISTKLSKGFNNFHHEKTWFADWAQRNLGSLEPGIQKYSKRFYEIIFTALVDAGIFHCREIRDERIWGIMPEALAVVQDVGQLRCAVCGHMISAGGGEADILAEASCLRSKCPGNYARIEAGNTYYSKLYASADIHRIIPSEHSSLLERSTREDIERKFIAEDTDPDADKRRKPWFPNLLSCTPTLEMGIDIGNLSAGILCNIPPTKSGYLQRIGRTGRRDGNSYTLSVANAKHHDLYFFCDPREMIDGNVETPGCYLNASAVLERQFTAFCLDNWVAKSESGVEIPKKLGLLADYVKKKKIGKFPFTFLNYVELNRTLLLKEFFSTFPEIQNDTAQKIKSFAEGGGGKGNISHKILEAIESVSKEIDALRTRIKALKGAIEKAGQSPLPEKERQEMLDSLESELLGFAKIASGISDKDSFNFFTDSGLLPNYAFPESGIQLKSLILKKKMKPDKGGNFSVKIFEYERPAVSGIVELAPGNDFYAEGRKVTIDEINMKLADVEEWRFCDSCQRMELVALNKTAEPACPKCGSAKWSDSGQKRKMLRMRQVIATTFDRESRIYDDSDDRDRLFYQKNLLVNFNEDDVAFATKLDNEEFPFGFEYVRNAHFREINFGEKAPDDPGKIGIAGNEYSIAGFQVCQSCGKVRTGKAQIKHAFDCAAAKRGSATDNSPFECLYLYREFSSEAIRILLPISFFSGSDQRLQSFTAAIMLGLKKRFHGNIDNLRYTVQEEPLQENRFLRKKFLVIYDSVPGGTGYLKELMSDKDSIFPVFDSAIEMLKSCSCNGQADKDGCYRCLLAYGNSFEMMNISRDNAIGTLNIIMENRSKAKQIKTIDEIRQHKLIESELEALFIEALRRYAETGTFTELKKDVFKNRTGWHLMVAQKGYFILPQVELKKEDDAIPISTRPDFIIYPEKEDETLPIAIYLDGYTFHTEGGRRSRIGDDTAKRMGLLRSGKFRVWSLSWDDIQARMKGGSPSRAYLLKAFSQRQFKFAQQLAEKHRFQFFNNLPELDSFALLMKYLESPDCMNWRGNSFVYASAYFQKEHRNFDEIQGYLKILCEGSTVANMLRVKGAGGGEYLSANHSDKGKDEKTDIELFSFALKEAVAGLDPANVGVLCRLFDSDDQISLPDFKDAWNGFLRIFNIFQFLPNLLFISSQGLADNSYTPLEFFSPVKKTPSPDLPDEYNGILDVTYSDCLAWLMNNGIAIPPVETIPYELTDQHNAIIAQAELAWPDKKIAVLSSGDAISGKKFAEYSWKVITAEDFIRTNNELLNIFNMETLE